MKINLARIDDRLIMVRSPRFGPKKLKLGVLLFVVTTFITMKFGKHY